MSSVQNSLDIISFALVIKFPEVEPHMRVLLLLMRLVAGACGQDVINELYKVLVETCLAIIHYCMFKKAYVVGEGAILQHNQVEQGPHV